MDIKNSIWDENQIFKFVEKTNMSHGQVEKKRFKCNTFILNWLIKSQNTAHERFEMKTIWALQLFISNKSHNHTYLLTWGGKNMKNEQTKCLN